MLKKIYSFYICKSLSFIYIVNMGENVIVKSEKRLTIKDFYDILYTNTPVEISSDTIKEVEDNYEFLKNFSKDKIIYGINTGLGPMAQYKIDDQKREDLQLNLIRSHSCGLGEPIRDESVKAAMLTRLNCFSKGYSGVHKELIVLLKEMVNKNIIPYIPEHGGVGASGDLVQLSHLALVLIGESKVKYKGQWKPTADVFKELNLLPIKIHIREGLAIINGTAVMSGIGMVNVIHARNLLNWMLIAAVMLNEIVETFDDHYSKELNSVKRHHGQQVIASAIRRMLKGSDLTKRRQDVLYNGSIKEEDGKLEKKVQEYYSLRCLPQILGPVYDTLVNAEEVIENEVNSVNDNPIIDKEAKYVFHGGNFHGDYVSLEMDKLKIATTKLTMLSERQLNFLLNHRINKILPPFVNLGKLGLNLGMQGIQFTATSTTAENQTLSNPMYVHSIPNNNDNQDIVSMGTNSALITKKVIDNAFGVVSIELMTLLQAIDYLDFSHKMSDVSKDAYAKLRAIFPKFTNDYALHEDILKTKEYIITNRPEII